MKAEMGSAFWLTLSGKISGEAMAKIEVSDFAF